ncbi:MAG TPA: hypothetical protein PK156_30115, partial [Polyangium sp.]|nr:hypothetical protein [Polyangium sp.]
MKTIAAEIQSLGIEIPHTIRKNDYWRTRHPALVQQVEAQGQHKAWTRPAADAPVSSLFLQEMARYL